MTHHRGMKPDATDEDAEWEASVAEEEADRQRKLEPPPALIPEAFAAWRSPRVVEGHPTRLDNPLWHWLVRTRWSAFHANEMFKGPSPFGAGPMWCFDRFGMSRTELPDGRVVHIGGEHEDYYDPDFCIYNDVTVIDAAGGIAIHGYPPDDFPPTDFHTATLMDDGTIVVIGRLGYGHQRIVGETPVYRLALDTMRIARVATHGDAPGWIHGHTAELCAGVDEIVVRGGEIWRGERLSMAENLDAWSLRVGDGRWTRLSALDWQTWTMLRVDRRRNRLWDARQELWRREHPSAGLDSNWRYEDPPDLEALLALYTLQEGGRGAQQGRKYNEFFVSVEGVTVRFLEDGFSVRAVVEGRIGDERLADLQRRTLGLLERVDASPWEIEA